MRIIGLLLIVASTGAVTPNWDSIDSRQVPDWYDKAKVGIFVHWGLYSVPGFDNEWCWNELKTQNKTDVVEFMEKNYKPGFTYPEFATQLTGEFFNASIWASLFQRAGAKYVVFTSKHHEGFTMYPSKYTYAFNSVDMGPKKDIVGELADAVRNLGMKYGVYHSLLEWYNPLYISDLANNTTDFVDHKIFPEMVELVNNYKPDIFWSDGDFDMPSSYWRAEEFLAWLFNESPVKDTVVTNDRWGTDATCVHGDIHTCVDRYNPGVLLPHKWENAMTIDWHSWAYRRNSFIDEYASTFQLVELLIQTVSCGGNILINVGPTKEGHISPIYQERLVELGDWLAINGEAIYESNPWTEHQNDTLTSGVWFTKKSNITYASLLSWPKNNLLTLGAVSDLFSDGTSVHILDSYAKLSWTKSHGVVSIQMPDKSTVNSNIAWVLKIE